jgi:hypothetical protein
VAWCELMRPTPPHEWMNVLWSDESPFVLRYCRKKRVWRIALDLLTFYVACIYFS